MKPVAWAIKSDGNFTEIGFDNDLLEEVEEMYAMEGWKYEVVPLYTTPKELSDDEILSLQWMVHYADASELVEFARAILKKASEK